MAVADKEVEEAFSFSSEDYRLGMELDLEAAREGMDNARRLRNAKQRAYRKANRERINRQRRERYAENREHVLEQNRAWAKRNAEHISARRKVWYAENYDRIRQGQKEYRERNREKLVARNKDWREKNREKDAARHRAWYQENREEILAKKRESRRAVTCSRRLKRRGLPAQQPHRAEYQQAIPVCPTVLSEVTLSAQLRRL